MAHFKDEGSITPNQFALGHTRARKAVFKAGAGVIEAATVIGQITVDKSYVTSLAAANDGSQVPDAILAEAVDATDADVEAIIYIAGEFDQDKLILGAGHTLGSIDAVFRDKSIWLVKPMG
ncbi:head decoration protein [Rhodopseudomonas palustris]|uniref:head decoration protein n=1 Tax=Rhodopseudomonas palustris TaxID=1076 RepID=UPI000641B2D1|nr:head decoration protein [Rhodopseudomonas palustris]